MELVMLVNMQYFNFMGQSPSWESNSRSDGTKFPAFYVTRNFITVFTEAHPRILSWASWIQSTFSHSNTLRHISILFCHLCLGFPSGLFSSGLQTIIVYVILLSPIRTTLSLCLPKHHAMKTYWGSGSIAPRILDLSTRWRGVVSLTPRPLYPQGKSPWYPLDRRLGGPQSRSGRGDEEKISGNKQKY
jgi:hypothetical protein